MKNKKESRLKKFKKFSWLVICLKLLVLILTFFIPKKKFKKLFSEEKKEIKELIKKEETLNKFLKDSGKILKDFFIPHTGNDHKPQALRPKSLAIYLIIIIFLKALMSGLLFFIYPTPAELSSTITKKLIELTNQRRQEKGLDILEVNPLLVEAALTKANDMLTRDYFAHETPEGKRPWQWIDRSQYDYIYAGENLAMGFTSAEMIFSAFMKSPTHQRNILNPKYQEIGVAVLSGELAGQKTDVLVQFFATQRLALAQQKSPSSATESKTSTSPNIDSSQKITYLEPASKFTVSGAMVVAEETSSKKNLVDLIIHYSNILFIAFLIFVLISLLLNIFIKIKVQHPSLIIQTLAVIAVILAILFIKFHFLEKITSQFFIA